MLVRLRQILPFVFRRNIKGHSSFGDILNHYLTDIQSRLSTFCSVTRCHVTTRLHTVMPKRRHVDKSVAKQPKIKKNSEMGAVLSVCSCFKPSEQAEKSSSDVTENTRLLSEKNKPVKSYDKSKKRQDVIPRDSACKQEEFSDEHLKPESDQHVDITYSDITHIKETNCSSNYEKGATKTDKLQNLGEKSCERDVEFQDETACLKSNADQDGNNAHTNTHQEEDSSTSGQTELVSAQANSSGQTESISTQAWDSSGQPEFISAQGDSSGQAEFITAQARDSSGLTALVSVQGDSSGQKEVASAQSNSSGPTELVSVQGDSSGQTEVVSAQGDSSGQTEFITAQARDSSGQTELVSVQGDSSGQTDVVSAQGDSSGQTEVVSAQGDSSQQTEVVSAQGDSSGQTEVVSAQGDTGGQTELGSVEGDSGGQTELGSAQGDTGGQTEFVSAQGDSSGQTKLVSVQGDASGQTELVSAHSDSVGQTELVSAQGDINRLTQSDDEAVTKKHTILPKQLLDSITSNVSERCNSGDSWLETTGLADDDLSDTEVCGSQITASEDTHGESVADKGGKKMKVKDEKVAKPRPNYFIAIKMTNPKIHIGLGEVQRAVLSVEPRMKEVMIALPTLHLTLYVTHLPDDDSINRAATALQEAGKELREGFKSGCPVCEVSGLGTFRNQVVFAKISPGDALDQLAHIHDVVKKKMAEHGLEATDDSALIPHITLMKMSKAKGHFRRSVAKKIDPDLYKEFKDMTFGEEVISSLQLCSMVKQKDVLGYYQVLHKVDLSCQETTVSEFCEGLVQSALVSAVETVKRDLYKAKTDKQKEEPDNTSKPRESTQTSTSDKQEKPDASSSGKQKEKPPKAKKRKPKKKRS